MKIFDKVCGKMGLSTPEEVEPENNIEMIIKGYLESNMRDKPLIIVGRIKTSHGSLDRKSVV